MVASKEGIFEWELQVSDLTKSNILKEDYKPVKFVQEKQELKKPFLKKTAGIIKARESLAYAILVNVIILVSSIVVITSFIVIGGFLANPILILGVLMMVLLFTLVEVFKLVEKETKCKNSR